MNSSTAIPLETATESAARSSIMVLADGYMDGLPLPYMDDPGTKGLEEHSGYKVLCGEAKEG